MPDHLPGRGRASVNAGRPNHPTTGVRALPRTKGAAFRDFVRWYDETHGRDKLLSAVASLPPEWRALLDPSREALGVLVSTWYPSAMVNALFRAAGRHLSPVGRSHMVSRSARAVVDGTLVGVYRALFDVVATPERHARHAQRLWDAFYDNGRSEVVARGPAHVEVRWSEWAGHDPLVCEVVAESGLALYEAMGLSGVVMTRTGCVSDGAPHCSCTIRWRR